MCIQHCTEFSKTTRECFVGLITASYIDGKQHPVKQTQNALHIKMLWPLVIFDTQDTQCKASNYSKSNLVVIGTWKNSKRLDVTGYVDKIKMAWAIDTKNNNFINVPINIVRCEVTEDRS